MTSFCSDRDLLALEPTVFLRGTASQQFASGTDGTFASGVFSSATANLVAAGIAPGMILTTSETIPAEGVCYEILSVDSASTLTASILRTREEDPAIPPADATNLAWRIRTFAAHFADTSAALGEELRQRGEIDFDAADFVPSDQLRRLCAYGTLAAVFLGRCQRASGDDIHWIKAEHYRDEFRRQRNTLTLLADTNSDSEADASRSFGNVQLRRR
jgi:hypothetical protein